MKIIRNPTVRLMGRQVIEQPSIDRFLEENGVTWETDTVLASEHLVETAGRICYMSFAKPRPGGNAAYINHILGVGHGSVLEHAVWNFLITGVSRTFSHELVRHRAGWGYSQLSQRYVDESVAEYIEPDIIAKDPVLHNIWEESVMRSHVAYVSLAEKLTAKLQREAYEVYTIDFHDHNTAEPDKSSPSYEEWLKGRPAEARTALRKEARQAARSVLPNATETKVFCTANARAIRHFIEMRASRMAEPEIRKVAVQLCSIMQTEAPAIFGDYTFNPLPDGTYEAVTPHRKV